MKHLLFLFLFACTFQLALAQKRIELSSIHTLQVDDLSSVNVMSGEANYIIFPEGETNSSKKSYAVNNGVLNVSSQTNATIVLTSLSKLRSEGGSKVSLTAGNKFPDLEVRSQDVSDVTLNGNFKKLRLEAQDGSKIMIIGAAENLDATISDVARVNGVGSQNNYVRVKVSDSGSAEFNNIDEKDVSDAGYAGPGTQDAETIDGDTTRILTRDKEIIITDRDGDGDDDGDMDDDDEEIFNDFPFKKSDKWKKHLHRGRVWSGLELSLNGFSEEPFKFDLSPENKLLTIEQPSVAFHLNLFEKSFKLGTEYLKFVTGLGFQFDMYKFKNTGVVIENSAERVQFHDSNVDFTRNRLILNQFVVPALININTNPGRKNFHIDAGVILGARFKQKHQLENKDDYKTITESESRSSFHQNPFNVAGTVRLGFSAWSIFAMYDINPLYRKDEGPQVHTWHFGITLLPF